MMGSIVSRGFVPALCFVLGCGAAVEVDGFVADETAGGAKSDQGTASVMDRALQRLADVALDGDTNLQRALARKTLARIQDGDVVLRAVADATGRDLWHMCRDLERFECGDSPPEDEDWAGPEGIRAALAEDLDGYQWGNRLYFSLHEDTDIEELAGTLVHEVNHVLNRSECSYYIDIIEHTIDHELAFIEEYRAFFAECFFTRGIEADLETCARYAEETLDDRGYDFHPDLDLILPDGEGTEVIAMSLLDGDSEWGGEYGALVPHKKDWPGHFEPCE